MSLDEITNWVTRKIMTIRLANENDWPQIWNFFKTIVRAGETYGFATDISQEDARSLWMDAPVETYVFEEGGRILGSYFLKTNFQGNADHVSNCGYMVSEAARGKGVASQMCQHSMRRAKELGYKAMQFNFVVSTNEGAIRLWQKLGFEIVGRVPKAFNHPQKGFVDSLVMYQWLEN